MSKVIDYDAIADQHGGTIDYDELAKQHGAVKTVSLAPLSARQAAAKDTFEKNLPAKSWIDSATDFANGFGSMVNPLPALETLYKGSQFEKAHDALKAGNYAEAAGHLVVAGTPASMVETFKPLAAQIGNAQLSQFKKAKDAFDQGNYSEAVGHTIAGVTPLVGPAAAQSGEDIGKGEAAKGLGEASALLTPAAIHTVGPTVFRHVFGDVDATGLKNAAAEAAEAKASRIGARVMAPVVGPNKVRFGNVAADIAPEVLAKTSGLTKAGLRESIANNLQTATDNLDAVHEGVNPNRMLDTENLVESLEKRRAELRVEGDSHEPITPENHTSQAEALDQAIQEAKSLGQSANFQNLRKLRIAWDQGAKLKYMPSTAADVLKAQGRANGYMKAAGELRDFMAEAEPGTPGVNADYHLWKQANDVMQAAEETERTRPTGLRTAAGRIAGAGIARGAGGGMFSELVGAAVGPAVDWALTQTSTAGKIFIARQLARLGSAMRVGDGAASDAILGSIHDRIDLEGGPPPGLKGKGLGPEGEGPIISPPAPFSPKVKQLRSGFPLSSPVDASIVTGETAATAAARRPLALAPAPPAPSSADVSFRQQIQPSSGEIITTPGAVGQRALPPGQYEMRGDVSPSSPSPSSTIQSFMKDRNVIDNHPVRMGLGKELVGKAQDRSARLEAGSMKATPAARSDYLNKLRDAAETHWPEAMPKVNAAAEALQSDDIKQFAALAESARAELSHGYAERVSRAAAAKAGITPRDINKARSAKIGANLPDADVESAATSEMQQFAQDVREMQRHREAVSGGGATTMKSNAAGKEIEENLSDDWSRVGKSLGVSAPSGLDMTPGRIANAIEKGGGKDFLRIRAAFQDAAKQGRAAYRESQRESGVGPQALRQRALLALRRRMKAE